MNVPHTAAQHYELYFKFRIFFFIAYELLSIVFCIYLLFMDYHLVYIIYEFLVIVHLKPFPFWQ